MASPDIDKTITEKKRKKTMQKKEEDFKNRLNYDDRTTYMNYKSEEINKQRNKVVIEKQKPSLDKEEIAKLPITWENIINVLRGAFEGLEQVNDEDIVVAIGNTGVGKSTMLMSLIYGPQCLEE